MSVENSRKQIQFAQKLARGKVVTPCVRYAGKRDGTIRIIRVCPLLDVIAGDCTKGYVKSDEKPVSCPNNNETIRILTDSLALSDTSTILPQRKDR